jgi:hypothetical protein
MEHTITYDIFRNDSAGKPIWVEAIDGLEQAMNRMEEIAAADPTSDYFVYCTQAEKIVRRLPRRSAPSDGLDNKSHKKAV